MLHKKRKPSTFTSSSGFADCKRNATSNNNMFHSKSTYFYRWVPISCSLALLLGLGIIVNPVVDKVEPVYAATDDECKTTPDDKGVCAMELGITMQGSDGSDVVGAYTEQPATALSTEEAAFRSYSFKVRAIDTDKDGYKLYANAVPTTLDGKDYTNKLVNADYPEFSINPLGAETTGTAIPAGQWGYALTKGDNTSAAASGLTYKAVPTGTTETATPVDTDTDTDLVNDVHTDRPYKIHFGARADEGMAAGHYRTQVLLSLVASPKKLAGATMQAFAEAGTCATLSTGDTQQFTDDRSASGIAEQKTYWVSKLKDGKCWMTQNLDLPLKQGNVLKPDDTNVTANYTVPALGNYQDMGDYVYTKAGTSMPSSSCGNGPSASGCATYFSAYTGSVDGDTQMHYHVGNLYPWTIAMAGKTAEKQGSICPKGWRLPTQSEYDTLRSGLTYDTIRRDPYYFVPSGFYSSGWGYVASGGNYWSSTPDGSSSAYALNFISGTLSTGGSNRPGGFSVRCVVSGA